MATGNSLIQLSPLDAVPPATLYATLDYMVGTSTPAENIPVLDFDDTTQEYIDFYCQMPSHYAGGGITLKIKYSTVDTTDVVSWQAAFRRVADDAEDLDTTVHSYDYNEVVDTAPSVVGEVAYATITFTDGADMDSVAVGEYFILRVTRDPTPSSGTDVTGDASIHVIEMLET